MIVGKYFGADDFRGETNVDLTVEHAYRVSRFLGWYYGQKMPDERCRVVIKKDTRCSNYMSECSLVAGPIASGADVYLLRIITTPSASYVVRTKGSNRGVVISTGHSPFYDSGIKIINGRSEKLKEFIVLEIEKYLDGETTEIPLAKRGYIGRTVDFAAGRNRYIGYLISIVTHSFRNMKVALDCSNGSAFVIARSVFDALGAETHVINNEPNGLNISMGCSSTHIEYLQEFVVDEKYDTGSVYNGDADRCIAVGKNGCVVDGDSIMYTCDKYMKEQGSLFNNMAVTTIMSNFGLYRAFDREGIAYVKIAVGDKYVYKGMAVTGHCLGGEQFGHIIFSKHATTGDDTLTSLEVMEMVLEKKQPLDKLALEVEIHPQVLKNVRVKNKGTTQGNETVRAEVARATQSLDNSGKILLRQSGTEPAVRIMVEAPDIWIYETHVDQVTQIIKDRGYCIWTGM